MRRLDAARTMLLWMWAVVLGEGMAMAQEAADGVTGLPQTAAVSARSLQMLDAETLDGLYRGGRMPTILPGWVKGHAIVRPGTRLGPAFSRGARAVWQGKQIRDDGTAVNRFFGVWMIEGRLSEGASWLDGAPALILDYADTSRVYGKYRDEIREVAPGLYLGLMYDRTTNPPTFVRYFALEQTGGH